MGQKIALTPQLRTEYDRLYAGAATRPERVAEVGHLARKIAGAWARYEAVADTLGCCPAHLVALIHAMECGLDFTRHLHNGDPLTARTVHVPAGRPLSGQPPYTWEQSATDALSMHGVASWSDWSLPGLCYVLEGYNGWGYRRYHPEVPSPYLWSGTSAYTAGKYVADGSWSATAVSRQCGAMALLRGLAEVGHAFSGAPDTPRHDPILDDPHPYPGTVLRLGSSGDDVRLVQERLVALGYPEVGKADGLYWRKTCDAVRNFQRAQGLGVDGAVGDKTWGALWEAK